MLVLECIQSLLQLINSITCSIKWCWTNECSCVSVSHNCKTSECVFWPMVSWPTDGLGYPATSSSSRAKYPCPHSNSFRFATLFLLPFCHCLVVPF
jgi:hypothetical protein